MMATQTVWRPKPSVAQVLAIPSQACQLEHCLDWAILMLTINQQNVTAPGLFQQTDNYHFNQWSIGILVGFLCGERIASDSN